MVHWVSLHHVKISLKHRRYSSADPLKQEEAEPIRREREGRTPDEPVEECVFSAWEVTAEDVGLVCFIVICIYAVECVNLVSRKTC